MGTGTRPFYLEVGKYLLTDGTVRDVVDVALTMGKRLTIRNLTELLSSCPISHYLLLVTIWMM